MKILGCRNKFKIAIISCLLFFILFTTFLFSPLGDKYFYGFCKYHRHFGEYCPYPDIIQTIVTTGSDNDDLTPIIILSNPANFPSLSFGGF